MICIYCFHTKTSITNSRGHKKEAGTWRRHHCPQCGRTFSTTEQPVMSDSYKITDEKAATDAPYSRSHLSASLQRSFGHLSGEALYEAIDWLTDTIERAMISAAYYGALSKDELGMIAYEVVKNYDAVAGVQYAAQNGLVSAVNQKRRGRPSLR
jgi:transcriptional regulator NrdR family protein